MGWKSRGKKKGRTMATWLSLRKDILSFFFVFLVLTIIKYVVGDVFVY